jgi:3-oxoacyl-[acyl-carrier protein] reductase
MDFLLNDRRILVAAASSGLGYTIAHRVASEGARVAICSRSEDRIGEAAGRITAETGAEVAPAACDVAEPGAVTAWIDTIAGRWGGVDGLVCNAGGPPPGRFADLVPEQWDAAYRLTLRSAMEAARAVRPHMGRGSAVLYMTSVSARQPIGTLVLSTIFRAGVAALSKSLADEWGADGIRVNNLIPGRIATNRLIELDEHAAVRQGKSADEVRSEIEATIPLGRYGDPDEYAAAAAFLLSPAASYITGATLAVDGGLVRSLT